MGGDNRKGVDDVNMKVKVSDYVRQAIRENLLTALSRAAQSGDSAGAIRLSKYLLKVFHESHNEFVELGSKSDE